MNLTESEKRMVYQIEGTTQGAALHELSMTWRYAPNQAVKNTAEGLMKKNYRLPEKARTIGELLAEARQKSGAEKLSGHDIMALERFDDRTRHMIVFDVLSRDAPVGDKGDKMRLFLTDQAYQKALDSEDKGHIHIRNHAKVIAGNLHYDRKDREL